MGSEDSGWGRVLTTRLRDRATAPFADELIRRGKEGGREASKTLRYARLGTRVSRREVFRATEILIPWIPACREHLAAQNPDHVVLVHLWYDRRLLMQSLQQNRIISAPSTWNSFAQGFCREPLAATTNSMNACFELRQDRIEQHTAATLSRLGHMKSIERVVLVGMHPSAGIFDGLLTLKDADESLPAKYTQGILPRVEM